MRQRDGGDEITLVTGLFKKKIEFKTIGVRFFIIREGKDKCGKGEN